MSRIWIAVWVATSLTTLALAQEPGEPNQPPERGVARISVLNGDVSVRRGDSGEVVAAAVNAPVVQDDRLLTASSSRAEVQFDSANVLRIGAQAEVRFSDLQYRRYQVQVAIGTITYTVVRDSDAHVEISTPILGVRPLGRGAFRISVREDGSVEITVRQGEAEVATRTGVERLQAGGTMMARGVPEDPEFQIIGSPALDDWDHWNLGRDQELQRSDSYRRVSRDIYGVEDLDNHGRWIQDATYGQVWAPNVGPDWAPYRSGRWVWEEYYGWTWVSSDPWGWAPYHYGRWFRGPVGWCWYPGGTYTRHYWSPALVAFFGFGSGGRVGFGFGNIGWVPLAPYETVHPWWGRGYGRSGFFNNTTIVNNISIGTSYRNARYFNGVTAVSSTDFGRHSARLMGVDGNAIRVAGVVRGALPVTPDRSSFRLSDREVRGGSPQPRATQFYSRGAVSRPAITSPSETGPHAWRTFGEPVHGGNGYAPGSQSWQRFAPSYMVPRSYSAPAPYNGSQAVRISPAIVHERPAPQPTRSYSPPSSNSRAGGSSGPSHSSSSSHGNRGR